MSHRSDKTRITIYGFWLVSTPTPGGCGQDPSKRYWFINNYSQCYKCGFPEVTYHIMTTKLHKPQEQWKLHGREIVFSGFLLSGHWRTHGGCHKVLIPVARRAKCMFFQNKPEAGGLWRLSTSTWKLTVPHIKSIHLLKTMHCVLSDDYGTDGQLTYLSWCSSS